MLALFTDLADLADRAGANEPEAAAGALMLLYEGALATDGLATFAEPFRRARRAAALLLDAET